MSAPKRFLTPAAIAILAIAAVLVIIGALVSTEEETQVNPSFDFRAEDHPAGTAVVTSKHQRDGFTLFWIDFRKPEHRVDVAFTVPAECHDEIANLLSWPPADQNCAGPAGVAGPIAGSGRAANGDAIVAVAIDVSAECYDAVELGIDWQPSAPECAASR